MTNRPHNETPTSTILPHEMPHALERGSSTLTTLSLDCFDTLLWRDCHAPVEVFADLPGLQIRQRAGAEANARKIMRTLKRRNEVTLEDIYAQVLPNADKAARDNAIAAELDAEARACFAFAPTVELMLAAKARGLEVIIVSDTYLTANQLRGLIAAAAGEEIAGLIDRIFASCEYGVSKGEGLLAKALKAIKCPPRNVLHIGDNKAADYDSARALGIPALHLKQFSDATKQRLRFERTCAQFDAKELGSRDPYIVGLQPHRALLAVNEPQIDDRAVGLGYSVLGPVFTAYDSWLREEAARLKAERGGTVHWLFMLRDGHLPDLVHGTGPRASSTGRVEISRYVATSASLISREAYQQHLALEHGLNPSTLARQMLMREDEITRVIGNPQSDAELTKASQKLLSELRRGQRQKITARRAREMADGMIAHIRAEVNPQPGDTLMLVDLGYNGSAQNAIDALLQDELGVHVAGRYLLCRERNATGLDKTGLIDERHFDPGLLEAMCANVAVIEQLATCELGSVIGYDDKGAPLRKESSVKGSQSKVRDQVQAGTIAFAKAAQSNPVIRMQDDRCVRAWRECAASVLTRFMFLPNPTELNVLKSFEHDVNLGSERMVALFDQDDAAEQMKRRGLFYMKGSSRMFLPADLAQEDMSTRLALLAQKRLGMGLSYADYAPRTLRLTSFYIGGGADAVAAVEACATHDGYYVARIPISGKSDAIALQLGEACNWVEIAGVSRSRIATLTGKHEDEAAIVCDTVRYDAMKEHAPGIFECLNESALLMVALTDLDQQARDAQMIEIVLRPIKTRGQQSLAVSDETPATSHEKAAA